MILDRLIIKHQAAFSSGRSVVFEGLLDYKWTKKNFHWISKVIQSLNARISKLLTNSIYTYWKKLFLNEVNTLRENLDNEVNTLLTSFFPVTSSILRDTWQKSPSRLILRMENDTGLGWHSFCSLRSVLSCKIIHDKKF